MCKFQKCATDNRTISAFKSIHQEWVLYRSVNQASWLYFVIQISFLQATYENMTLPNAINATTIYIQRMAYDYHYNCSVLHMLSAAAD